MNNNLNFFSHIKTPLAKNFIFLLIIGVAVIGCTNKKKPEENRIIIGVQSDVQTINPMYAFSIVEGNLIDLLFMKPAMEIWNESRGIIDFKPMLAERWQWADNGNKLTLYLRSDIFWSDGVPITTEDIVYTFDVYSNPKVESRFLGQFKNFYTIDGLQIDINKTFNIISPNVLEINFREGSNASLLDINLEIIPKHVWSNYKVEEFPQAQTNFEPVTSGPFILSKWDRESLIKLRIDSSGFLYNPENIEEVIFKVIPDYRSRITHLKTRAIDLLDNIKSEDVDELMSNDNLYVFSLKGRDYDYIGWNHIDPQQAEKSGKALNKFFAFPDVRIALSHAINRKEILETYLNEFAELCKGPVSPMFREYYNADIEIYDYDPVKAREILKSNGWIDTDGNGIIEKDDIEFNFNLYISTGNPRRNYVATIVKNNLKAVGIEANIQTLEMGAFVEKLMKREFDAWIAGWTIPVPIDLNPYWNSDPEIGFLNLSSYQNEEKDKILDSLQLRLDESTKIRLYRDLQKIFHMDEPVTFLYWVDNIVAYNKKITPINFSMLGLVKNAWEWKIE